VCKAVQSANGRALAKNGWKRVKGRRAEACGGPGFGRGAVPHCYQCRGGAMNGGAGPHLWGRAADTRR